MIVDPEPYTGPFVTLRNDGALYNVTIEPLPVDGDARTRTYACKSQAWLYASGLWSAMRLPFKDFTDGYTGNTNNRKPRDE